MGKSSFFHPFEDRLLTPREHARLMTFPDNYKFMGGTTQVYDIIGEAVPPLLTEQIGNQFISNM
jgi:DNA (cytosine-5)-methyltransferase 1